MTGDIYRRLRHKPELRIVEVYIGIDGNHQNEFICNSKFAIGLEKNDKTIR